jgi:hypothetical protein
MSRFQEGQKVMRLLAGTIEMPMTITKVHEGLAHCGPWTFDDETGVEEDPDLGFGVAQGLTGSYIKECTEEEWEAAKTRMQERERAVSAKYGIKP